MVHLIDVSGFIYRAFYGLPSLIYAGQEVGALYGFCSAMQKITILFPHSMFIAALDCCKRTFRNEIYDQYKATRKAMPEELVAQIPLIKTACDKFGFYRVESPGFEADDVIATYTSKIHDQPVNIISSDKDLMQLMSDKITIYDPMKRKYITTEDVIKKFGVTPDKVLDVLSLMGDTSDNVPGVPGIGAKTAATLINEYGSLDNLIANLDKLPKSKRNDVLKAEINKAILSKKLISLRTDLDVKYEYKETQQNGLNEFLLNYGFKSLIKSNGKQNQFFNIAANKEQEENPLPLITGDLSDKKLQQLKTRLEDPEIQKLCSDAKILYKKCLAMGINLVNTIDISVMSYCVSGTRTRHDIASMETFYNIAGNVVTQDQKQHILKKLYIAITDKLSTSSRHLFYDIENKLPEILAKMEYRGIKVDICKLKELEIYFTEQLEDISQKIYKIVGEKFNIASPKQVSHILYEKIGFKHSGKKLNTDSDTLMAFSGKRKGLANKILDWRGYSKLLNSYVRSFLRLADKNSRIHTTYTQMIVNTGRLSSSDPNLQNIPIRTKEGQKIRNSIIASDGYKLVSFDYSQMELRILAHMSSCERLKNAFLTEKDIHRATAAHIFNISEELVSPEQRRLAKVINFSVIYGMTARGMSRRYDMPKKQVYELFSRFMRLYPEIFIYMENLEKYAEQYGFVETILGRKCFTPLIHSPLPHMVSFAKRQAINAPIQGSNADIIKMAMIKLNALTDIHLLLQIHDELIFEIPDALLETRVLAVKNIMENIFQLCIPLKVDVKIGKTL
ncbi:MAG: hypothetical protein IJS10_03255 [Alphaproteobacteria bacterium]|nr:hypothetical protein [Alphaproteobacteria bacterium]